MNLEKWGGRGKKELIHIPSVGHLKYDRFKQNVKQDNFIEQTLKALSCNIDDNYNLSSTINLCCYLVENYEDEFIPSTDDSGLAFSTQMPAIETVSMMSDDGLNISQLRIILRTLHNKLDEQMFKPENVMKSLSGDMIHPKFGEYKYNHEKGSKPENNLFWDFVEVDNYIFPILHNQINLGNSLFHNLLDYGNENIEKLSVDEDKARNSLLLIDSAIDEKVNLRDEFDVFDEGKELNSLKNI